MINAFALHATLTESVGRGRFNVIEPYQFVGDIETNPGIFSEASQIVALEAYGVQELYTRTDELMSEAAASGVSSSRINVMVENVFSKLIENVKKVWNKIIEAIKGLIAKLKAFALRITNQTGKWVSAMRPKIEAAQKRTRASSAKAEMYEWKNDMFNKLVITDKVSEEVSETLKTHLKVITHWVEDSRSRYGKTSDASDGYVTNVSRFTKDGKDDPSLAKESGKYSYAPKGKDLSDDDAKSNTKFTDQIEKDTESIKKDLDRVIKEMYKKKASELGVSGSDADTIASNLKTKVYGTKKTITYGSNVTAMLKAVEDSKDLITTTSEAYDSKLDQLNKELEAIEEVETSLDRLDSDSGFSGMLSALKANGSAVLNELTQVRKSENSFYNKLKSIATQAVKDRASDYMRVLTKFANTKDFSD